MAHRPSIERRPPEALERRNVTFFAAGLSRQTTRVRYFAVMPLFTIFLMLAATRCASQTILEREVEIDIPAKPLAAALRDYGKITGIEVFYDGSLALGRRSSAVKGRFKPLDSLKVLLRGTNYVSRTTEIPNTLTIVPGPSISSLRKSFEPYQHYFATIQTRLSEALCAWDEAAASGRETKFRIWVDRAGTIINAEALAHNEDSAANGMFAQRVRGLAIGKPPPDGLPQPVTMLVYPPSQGETAGCAQSK